MLLLLTGAGVAGYFGFEEYKKAQVQVLPETEAISFGERAGGGVILDVSGYIVPKNKVQIAPQAAGKIVSLPIEEGMIVKKGDIICRLEDDTYRADESRAKASLALAEAQLLKLKNGTDPEEIGQAKSMLDSSEASLKEAGENLERTKKLVMSKASPAVELEKAQSAYTNAENQVSVNKSKLAILVRGAREEDIAVAEDRLPRRRRPMKMLKSPWPTPSSSAGQWYRSERNAREGELILPQTAITSLCVSCGYERIRSRGRHSRTRSFTNFDRPSLSSHSRCVSRPDLRSRTGPDATTSQSIPRRRPGESENPQAGLLSVGGNELPCVISKTRKPGR